jgi:hypothetical protein
MIDALNVNTETRQNILIMQESWQAEEFNSLALDDNLVCGKPDSINPTDARETSLQIDSQSFSTSPDLKGLELSDYRKESVDADTYSILDTTDENSMSPFPVEAVNFNVSRVETSSGEPE